MKERNEVIREALKAADVNVLLSSSSISVRRRRFDDRGSRSSIARRIQEYHSQKDFEVL